MHREFRWLPNEAGPQPRWPASSTGLSATQLCDGLPGRATHFYEGNNRMLPHSVNSSYLHITELQNPSVGPCFTRACLCLLHRGWDPNATTAGGRGATGRKGMQQSAKFTHLPKAYLKEYSCY